jgi:hypothetical protein
MDTCPVCGGQGQVTGSCVGCRGKGTMGKDPCPVCGGSGKGRDTCTGCKGKGRAFRACGYCQGRGEL